MVEKLNPGLVAAIMEVQERRAVQKAVGKSQVKMIPDRSTTSGWRRVDEDHPGNTTGQNFYASSNKVNGTGFSQPARKQGRANPDFRYYEPPTNTFKTTTAELAQNQNR